MKKRLSCFIGCCAVLLLVLLMKTTYAQGPGAPKVLTAVQTVKAAAALKQRDTDVQKPKAAAVLKLVQSQSLNPPRITSITATAKGTVKFVWSGVDGADYYEIYRKPAGAKKYTKLKRTAKTKYCDKSGQASTVYRYKVRAVGKDAKTGVVYTSGCSNVKKCRVRKVVQRTAYVGDSIMTGFTIYGIIPDNETQRVFAKVGINTYTFYTTEWMRNLLDYNPDRLYIMMGANGLPGNPTQASMNSIISYYDQILAACLNKNPDMEIIVMSVSPVGRNANIKLSSVAEFNRLLKSRVLQRKGVHYLELADVLADSSGYLKAQYNGGDGVHWQIQAYRDVLRRMQAYVQEFS